MLNQYTRFHSTSYAYYTTWSQLYATLQFPSVSNNNMIDIKNGKLVVCVLFMKNTDLGNSMLNCKATVGYTENTSTEFSAQAIL